MTTNLALLALILLLLSTSSAVVTQHEHAALPSPALPIPDSVQTIMAGTWPTGIEGYEKVRNQQQSSEPIIVYFYADWCGFCKRLSRDILITPEVQRFLRGVKHVRINVQLGDRERALSKAYGVTGFPTFYIVASDSTRRVKIRPFTKGEAMPIEQFIQTCQRAISYLKES